MFTEGNKKTNYKDIIWQFVLSIIGSVVLICAVIDQWKISFSFSSILEGRVVEGFKVFINSITSALMDKNEVLFKEIDTNYKEVGSFIIFLGIILALILFFIIRSKKKKLLLIPISIIIVPTILSSNYTDIKYMILIFIYFGLVYAFMKKEKVRAMEIAFICLVGVLSLGISNLNIVEKAINKPAFINNIENKIENLIRDMYYGKSHLGQGELKQENREVSKDTALEIEMTKPEPMYLRGFIGEKLEKNNWKLLDFTEYRENRNLMYWLEKNNFNTLGQLGSTDKFLKENLDEENSSAENKVNVRIKNGNSKYMYLPYEVSKIDNPSLINWNGAYVTNGNFGRSKKYSFEKTDYAVSKWPEVAGKVFANQNKSKIEDYIIKESNYNEFVYRKYTYLSKDDRAVLEKLLGQYHKGQQDHVEYKKIIEKVKSLVNEKILYAEKSVRNKNDEKNGLNVIASESKGYDVQFATLGTAIFRYYGVPARYVEGYLVTPKDIENKKSNEKIAISGENIHSWTEIYIDGVGFIPIEFIKKYEDMMPEVDLEKGLENGQVNLDFENRNKNKKNLVREKKEKEDDEKNKLDWQSLTNNGLVWLFIIYIVLFALKKFIVKIKEYIIIHGKNIKRAIQYMFDKLERYNWDISPECRKICNKASYSNYEMTLEDKKVVFKEVKAMKKENWKSKLGYISKIAVKKHKTYS